MERAIERLESERACWAVLGAAMALSGALILWLTRGTSFFSDEFTYFVASRGFDPEALLSPHNGHLIVVIRLLYATVFKLFGADYLAFRLLEAFGISLVAALFFILAKRRVGPAVALAPAVLLLFLGSSADDALSPLGITHVYCVAAGLGAIIALERHDLRGDVAGCALLVTAVATFSIGLAFLAGGTVSVLMRADRRRRAWIFLVPLLLYAAWLLLAPKLTGPAYRNDTHFALSNALLIPNFVVDAAAAVATAIAGLAHDFNSPSAAPGGAAPDITSFSWGGPLVAAAVAGLTVRLRAGGTPRSLWVSLAILVFFWISAAMVATFNRYPFSERYVYAGAVLMLLVIADALAGVKLPRRLGPALLALTLLALGANLDTLRTSSEFLRSYSSVSQADLAALELAGRHVQPRYVPPAPPITVSFAYLYVGGAGPVLDAVDRNGSFAFSLAELRAQPESVREAADKTLAGALGLRLVPGANRPNPARCRRPRRASPAAPLMVPLSTGRYVLRVSGSAPASVRLRRFASEFSVRLGALSPKGYHSLTIPPDSAPERWWAQVTPATSRQVTVCP